MAESLKTAQRIFLGFTLAACWTLNAGAQATSCSAISIGDPVVDPPTFLSLGFSLPILAGDPDYDATVSVEYRRVGDSAWKQALPLLRVRPETLSTESPPPPEHVVGEQFAGSIMNLSPDTAYEVRFRVQDPDGCDESFTVTARTRKEPPEEPANPNYRTVSSLQELASAVASASPGDVIVLSAGVHTPDPADASNVAVLLENKSGTFENPIVIRGENRDTTIIDAAGKTYAIRANAVNFIHIEDLTIRNAEVGIRLALDTEGVVIRRNILRGVQKGIWAKNYTKKNLTICDNDLRGPVQFPQTDSSTWDYEGIVVHGGGNVICYNTIAGFGDAMGFSKAQEAAKGQPPHRGNDFYGNDVLWSGDDCFEFDYSERNNRVFRNRCTNTANGISAQPVYGGPAYAFENIVHNTQKSSEIKPNNQPSGVFFYHNLFGLPWLNYAGSAYNIDIRNNLWVGAPGSIVADVSTSLRGGSESEVAVIDYNGWAYDGSFRLGRGIPSWSSFSQMQQDGYFETHGRLLTSKVFARNIPFPAEAGVFVDPIEDASLDPSSNAVDAGVRLPNINDNFSGAAPDLGPYELGAPMRHYGVRAFVPAQPDDTPPTVPTGVSARGVSETSIEVTWDPSSDPDSGVTGYRVLRDGVEVGQPSTTSYTDTGLAESTSYTYQVVAVNGAGLKSQPSAAVQGSTLVDSTPPALVGAAASGDPTRVEVTFSEPVDPSTAGDSSNYAISGGVSVLSATLQADGITVFLATTPHTDGQQYTLTVNNVRDRAASPNTIAPNSQATYVFTSRVVISNLFVASGAAYETSENLQDGDLAYIDRTYTYSQVPPSLLGASYIRTKNGDKNFSGVTEFLSFDVNQNVTVYVAHDDRYALKPDWLQAFADTGLDLQVSSSGTFSLYSRSFAEGRVVLGVNQNPNEPEGNSMYTVIVVPDSTPPPTDPPAAPGTLRIIK